MSNGTCMPSQPRAPLGHLIGGQRHLPFPVLAPVRLGLNCRCAKPDAALRLYLTPPTRYWRLESFMICLGSAPGELRTLSCASHLICRLASTRHAHVIVKPPCCPCCTHEAAHEATLSLCLRRPLKGQRHRTRASSGVIRILDGAEHLVGVEIGAQQGEGACTHQPW